MSNLTKVSLQPSCHHLGVWFVVCGVTFVSITLFLSSIFNGFILLSFIMSSTLRTLTYAFIMNLAVTNVISSLLVIPMEIVYLTSYPVFPFPAAVNNLWNAVYLTLLAGSIFNFTAVSLDRYVRIRYPLRYMQYLTKRLVAQLVIFLWVYVAVLGVLLYFAFDTPIAGMSSFEISSTYFIPFLAANVFVPFCVIAVLYACIFRITRRHIRCINVQTSTSFRQSPRIMRPWPVRRQTSLLRDLSSTKTICLVVFGFCLTWLPFFIFKLYLMYVDRKPSCGLVKVDKVVCWLTYFSAVSNPLIYAAREKNITQVIRKAFCVFNRSAEDQTQLFMHRLPENIATFRHNGGI